MHKNIAYILSGSNLGDRLSFLNYALSEIEKNIGEIENVSSIYESDSWGFESDKKFFNQCICIQTSFDAFELLKKLQKIETAAGRQRKSSNNYCSRTLDLDILFYNNLIIKNEFLSIPHPEIRNRRFTLLPLEEIAADYVHPIYRKTIRQINEACKDHTHTQITNYSNKITQKV